MDLTITHASPHSVTRLFSLLSDPRRRPEWQASLTGVEVVDAGEPRLGMRWRERPKGLVPVEMAIVAFEPDHLWAESISSALASGKVSMHFKPEASGSQVQIEVEVTLAWPWKLAEPLARSLLVREMRRDLQRADAILDA